MKRPRSKELNFRRDKLTKPELTKSLITIAITKVIHCKKLGPCVCNSTEDIINKGGGLAA